MPANPAGKLTFQYPIKHSKKPPKRNVPVPEPDKPRETVGLIQGKPPRSIEEWRVAVALWLYEVRFDYQVWLRGGTLLRGGQILDFLVYIPYPVPLQVFGEYWHHGQMGSEDHFKLAILRQMFNIEPIVLWGRFLQTQEETNQIVREALKL
jgi:hypothetical protein